MEQRILPACDAATTRVALYINGVLDNSLASSGVLFSFNSLILGADRTEGQYTHFAGLLDEVMIYERALAADDVQALFQGQLRAHPRGRQARTQRPSGSP